MVGDIKIMTKLSVTSEYNSFSNNKDEKLLATQK